MATLEEQEKVVNAGKHELDGRRCEVKVPDQRVSLGCFREVSLSTSYHLDMK